MSAWFRAEVSRLKEAKMENDLGMVFWSIIAGLTLFGVTTVVIFNRMANRAACKARAKWNSRYMGSRGSNE